MLRNTLRLSAALFGATLVAACSAAPPAATAPEQPQSAATNTGADTSETIAFVGADVLPMQGDALLRAHTVVVRDGRIVEVAPAATVDLAPGTRQIDARGKLLMPGLAEMHGHVPGPDEAQYARDVLFLYLANGVTTVRNMSGHPWHLQLRQQVEAGQVPGPNLVAASPWLGAKNAAEAVAKVRDAKQAGFGLIKIGDMPRDAYLEMARTAHALEIPFAGHVPLQAGLEGALQARQASIDHFDRYVEFLVPPGTRTSDDPGFFGSAWINQADRARMPEAVRKTVQAGTWNVPTLSIVEHLASSEPAEAMLRWPEFRYFPTHVAQGWAKAKADYAQRPDFQPADAARLVQLRRELLLALHQGGAPIALGSDAPQFFNVPGFSIHREMRMMVDAGMTPHDVLLTGTHNAARALGTPDAFGTVQVGRRADLLLLDADPRADIGAAMERVGVMVRGRWWPEAELQAGLADIAKRNGH